MCRKVICLSLSVVIHPTKGQVTFNRGGGHVLDVKGVSGSLGARWRARASGGREGFGVAGRGSAL